MPDREPEAWETNAAGPFLTLERAHGTVEVWALGADRFTVRASEHDAAVAGRSCAPVARMDAADLPETCAGGFIAIVLLGHGVVVKSDVEHLRPDVQEKVQNHNSQR
jgi:hypothetical protein